MPAGKFVAYYRVSTLKQGRSGLGLEAQRKAVHDYLNGGCWELLAEFTETESGKVDDRPELVKSLSLCELTGATLIIAKLDRLSRNLTFLSALQDSGARFVAADMPEANETMVQFMAVMAQAERKAISRRTKEALAAAKARGVQLGGFRGNMEDLAKGAPLSLAARRKAASERAAKVLPHIEAARAEGAASLREIAAALNARGITTPRGGRWAATQIARLLQAKKEAQSPL